MADMMQPTLNHYVGPVVRDNVSEEYRKWIPFVVKYASRMIAVTVAFMIQRVLASWHSAMRGAQLLLRGAIGYCLKHGHLTEEQVAHVPEGSRNFDVVVIGIAVVGFLWQLRSGYRLPFPLNVLLLPVSIVENALIYFTS